MRPERHLEKAEEAMRALARYGNADRAAAELKIHPDTLRKRVMRYCAMTGYDSPVQAAYWMGLSENPTKAA